MKKAFKNLSLKAFELSLGRGERIRTFDPLVPNQMRYQAALHPDTSDCNRKKQRTQGMSDFFVQFYAMTANTDG